MTHIILIAYFSREGNNYIGGSIVDLPVGNTETSAKLIQAVSGGDLLNIEPVRAYSNDYTACTEEAKKELHANARPELVTYPDSIQDYDTVGAAEMRASWVKR